MKRLIKFLLITTSLPLMLALVVFKVAKNRADEFMYLIGMS